ncbi:hypothetical protein ABIA16_001724 [Sinorhizobium fredii]
MPIILLHSLWFAPCTLTLVVIDDMTRAFAAAMGVRR